MKLNFSINFTDFNCIEGLKKLDHIFLKYLSENNQLLYSQLVDYRLSKSKTIDSDFFIRIGEYLDDFISELFFIEKENFALKKLQKKFDIIYECRRKFVQRVVKKVEHNNTPVPKMYKAFHDFACSQHNFSKNVLFWMQDSDKYKAELSEAASYAIYMVNANSTLALFNIPRTLDQNNLVRDHKVRMLKQDISLGFNYRDNDLTLQNALAQAKYCIYCHHQCKDSCRVGILSSTSNIFENGCPLDQKISEMNELFAKGFNIGALSVIVIDNPIVAATGHRICNDCMKSCIFQKQDPVNIPLIESKILDNVLNLPYGPEIYILLTKWNPLNVNTPLPKEITPYKILVVGLGPAGFALSHYLLNEGHNVMAIDGLKIQPLLFDFTKPIKEWDKIKVALSKREPQGFGGVAEYGITNRWDKNNLILVRLILERRANFKMMGGIRLGANIMVDQVFKFGFDHIALCLGAGKPRYINSASYFYKGVKAAADFLMNLQQGGSFLEKSNSKLLIRMPAVILGCGLTAIDSAVEIMHYYPKQVEMFLQEYDKIKSTRNDEITLEFIEHAKLFRSVKSDKEKLKIMQSLGGVSICYRKTIKDSPAYKRNHEEIEHAKAIGVKFIENITPLEIKADEYNYAKNIDFRDSNKQIITMKARTILVAIGTENVVSAISSLVTSNKDNRFSYFGDCNQKYSGSVVKALASAKDGYLAISNALRSNPVKKVASHSDHLLNQLRSTVQLVKSKSPNITELVINSPLAALNYKPGQIFRLQNYGTDITTTTKPIALSPFLVKPQEGLIYFFIAHTGNSTKLCTNLKPGEEIILMGPNGNGTKIPEAKKIILIGEGIRAMALRPIIKAFKNQGSEVVFLDYDKDDICSIQNDQDNSIIMAYVLPKTLLKIKSLFKNKKIIANLLAPMQCMMQGICGQCISKVDDGNGYVFACECIEYDIQKFDPQILINRLSQNSY